MITFDVIDLEQGSEAWRRWRSGGVGASDTPVLMGESRLKTIGDLRRERSQPGDGVRQSAAMARGTLLEPQARAAYCDRVGFSVSPLCIQSREFPWLRCSLDGICLDRMHIVEIKCGERAYKHTLRHGRPPACYVGQLQHAMAVTGLNSIDFWCYLPNRRPLLISMARDGNYIAKLVGKAREFWESTKECAERDS